MELWSQCHAEHWLAAEGKSPVMLQWVLRADGEQVHDIDSDPLGSNLAIFQLGDSDLVTSPRFCLQQ